MRRGISVLLTMVLVLSLMPATAFAAQSRGMDNFVCDGSYSDGLFTDVTSDKWYAKGVAVAYELGLMSGMGDGTFAPESNVRISEVISMAARLHRIYETGDDKFEKSAPWYQTFVDYAVENSIIKQGEFTNLDAPATRAEMVHIFAGAMPKSELNEVNIILDLPDVSSTTKYSEDIFLFYRAGILAGNDSIGTFTPNQPISRCQAAAIIARMALTERRLSVSLGGELSDAIKPLGIRREIADIESIDSVEPFSEYWKNWNGNNIISADLSTASALTYSLTFADNTQFPDQSKLPAGYDYEALLEWGKYPGLNVDILHKHGFTGEGAVVAYIDQPAAAHEEYDSENFHFTNNTTDKSSMHGPAVLSLLAGESIGTAPGAEVYFYGHATWLADQTTHAECLYQVIEQNKSLPEGKKITMVAFSDGIDKTEKNPEAFQEAVNACEEAGIMVWFCQEYAGASFLPLSDKNAYQNLIPEQWYGKETYYPPLVYVPSAGRTTAATDDGAEYIYWSSGGLSWTMPYALGLYAIAIEIDPTLTQDELRTLIKETAYDNNGMRIVNPVGFVAQVLKDVGRNSEADAMLAEVAARSKYLYAVMDTAAMSEEDLNAVGDYLATITHATVLVVDASSFASAEELYTAMQKDAAARGGNVVGVQIFGTPNMVPAFNVKYKVQMINGVDDEDSYFLTDLFYGNFDNYADEISDGYNVMDHFAEGKDIKLVPDWPVVRLPLEKGEYRAFFEKYFGFVDATGLEQQEIVNFSNPIFRQTRHTDDMGYFLNRAKNEFKTLNVPYRLYGNLEGDYPVSTKVIGGFTAENLAKENENGITEFILNTHGQWNNIDKCYFKNGEEIRESLVNMDTINNVLDGNYYYLDCWTCLNGFDMSDNLTTTALNGKCVGMFSATTIISNNGVGCYDSLDEMKQSNFYYFYYSYLKALDEDQTRSQAFWTAQREYGNALMEDSKNPIRGEGNYQFNLYNLLAYHNFGVIEPNAAASFFEAEGYIEQAGQSVPKDNPSAGNQGGGSVQSQPVVTDGKPAGTEISLRWTTSSMLKEGSYTIHSYKAQKLDNDYWRFSIDYTAPKDMYIAVFDPPNGDTFKLLNFKRTSGEREKIEFDIAADDISQADTITTSFNFSDDNRFFVIISTSQVR